MAKWLQNILRTGAILSSFKNPLFSNDVKIFLEENSLAYDNKTLNDLPLEQSRCI